MLIIHPFLTGRLACWKQVENWIVKTQETKHVWFATLEQHVWFATLEQIADHMDQLQRDAIWQPSVETLPYFDGPIMGGET